jgi:hypothetical protein
MTRDILTTLTQLNQRLPGLTSLLMLVLLAGSVLAVYLPALKNGYVWDDWLNVFGAQTSPEFWGQVLKDHLFFSKNYYRPIPVATFLAEYYFYRGPSSVLMHLTNIVLHTINTVLVAILALHFSKHSAAVSGRTRLVAFFAALIYGLHPVNVEAVAWISGRFDLLLTLFLLLALLANTYLTHWVARPLLVGTAFFAAAATKESAVVFPFVVFAWNMACNPRPILPLRQFLADANKRGELAVYLSVILAGLAYLALRKWNLGYVYIMDNTPNTGGDVLIIQQVLLTAEALGRYLFLSIYPYAGLSVTHPHEIPVAISDPLAWVSLAAVLMLILALVMAVRRQLSAGWLWAGFVATLLPVIHILPMPIGDDIIHERYLTYPLTVFVLAIAATTSLLSRPGNRFSSASPTLKRVALAVVLAFVVLMDIINIRITIPLWRDDLTLWSWAVAKTPESVIAHGNLGTAYLIQGDFSESLRHGLIAIELAPQKYNGWNVAALALKKLGSKEAQLHELQVGTAVSFRPITERYIILGRALMGTGRYHEAVDLLTRLAQQDPPNTEANELLGISYHRLGNMERAKLYIDRSLLAYPPEQKVARTREVERRLSDFQLNPKPTIDKHH